MLIHNDNSVSSQQYRGGHVYSVVVHVPANKSLCAYYSVTVMSVMVCQPNVGFLNTSRLHQCRLHILTLMYSRCTSRLYRLHLLTLMYSRCASRLHQCRMCQQEMWVHVSLVLRPSHHPVFDHMQFCILQAIKNWTVGIPRFLYLMQKKKQSAGYNIKGGTILTMLISKCYHSITLAQNVKVRVCSSYNYNYSVYVSKTITGNLMVDPFIRILALCMLQPDTSQSVSVDTRQLYCDKQF